MENMTYRLTDFEGPLDLLLALIEKNKMNMFMENIIVKNYMILVLIQ